MAFFWKIKCLSIISKNLYFFELIYVIYKECGLLEVKVFQIGFSTCRAKNVFQLKRRNLFFSGRYSLSRYFCSVVILRTDCILIFCNPEEHNYFLLIIEIAFIETKSRTKNGSFFKMLSL